MSQNTALLIQTLAAGVQALSAIGAMVVAIVLARITNKYVRLTEQMTRLTERTVVATEAQVEMLRAERQEEGAAVTTDLREQAVHLLQLLIQLPGRGKDAQQSADGVIRQATVPTTDETLD